MASRSHVFSRTPAGAINSRARTRRGPPAAMASRSFIHPSRAHTLLRDWRAHPARRGPPASVASRSHVFSRTPAGAINSRARTARPARRNGERVFHTSSRAHMRLRDWRAHPARRGPPASVASRSHVFSRAPAGAMNRSSPTTGAARGPLPTLASPCARRLIAGALPLRANGTAPSGRLHAVPLQIEFRQRGGRSRSSSRE